MQTDDGFEPLYSTPADKKKVVRELKDALKDVDELYIATDEDREGESIGWHLLQVLNPKVPVRRMVFHEITREAILEALDHTRSIDRAQMERVVCPYLVADKGRSTWSWTDSNAGLPVLRALTVATPA